MIIELLLSSHCSDCTTCAKNGVCTLQKLASQLGISEIRFENHKKPLPLDTSSDCVIRDPNKCILCGDCVRTRDEIQGLGILDFAFRGSKMQVMPAFNRELAETDCVGCGQCRAVCPTGAISIRQDVDPVWKALADKNIRVVAQIAPAVRVAIGDKFGIPKGENTLGRLVAALRHMGFDEVYDTNFGADLTVMEESAELLERLKSGKNLPLFTSCCPGWVSFMEKHFPELGENLSTAKSPQQMFGAIAKNYLAPKLGIDRRNFIVVSVMPCVAKKSEAARPEFGKDGDPDVNISITTRELAHMIRFANMNFDELEESDFDRPLGESTGAGVIFGTTGGVIEAAVRTAYEIQTKKTLPKLDFTELRGLAGIRSATIDFDGVPVKIGIAHGLGNARRLVEEIRAGRSPYHAIEIMACPGGCINGGGQPYHRGNEELLKRRAEALYAEDAAKPLRKSHENPDIQALYEEFLGEPCGPLSHELLHTRYYDRKPVVEPKK